MTPRRLNQLYLPPVWPLLRNLTFTLICFWAINSGASGGFRRGTLLIADNYKVYVMEPVPSSTSRSYGTPRLILSGGGLIGVAVDEDGGFVYYTRGSNKIQRAKLDGSEITDVCPAGYTYGIAIDRTEGKLYFTYHGEHKIDTVSLDGIGQQRLIQSDGQVKHLALDMDNRLLFYTKIAPSGIRKANMDGSGDTDVLPNYNGSPLGIAIDYGNCRICWVERAWKHIACCNYNGGDKRVVHTTTGSPAGLAIQDGVAYYSQKAPNGVFSVPLEGGTATSIDTGSYTDQIYAIAIVHGEYPHADCPIPGIVSTTAIAKGFRDFGDCAVFTDRKRRTCAKVTSSTNPYDFLLRADVSQCQNEARVRVVLKDGDCSDKTQVHVDTMEKSVGRGPFNGYFLRCELTKTEKPGGDLSLCSFCCQCPARGCDFVFVRVFGRNGPVRSLCEVELMDPNI